MKKGAKIFCAALALVIVFGAVVGGTLAWLMDKSETITNVFTVGNVDIDLDENEASDNVGKFKMIPGEKIDKTPVVTVNKDSEDCYLFVKVDETNNEDNGGNVVIEWDIEDTEGWNLLDGTTNVWYKSVDSSAENQEFHILKDDCVNVNDDLTQSYMDTVNASLTDDDDLNDIQPRLAFTAYAVQRANLSDSNADSKVDALDAWALFNPPTQNG